MRFPKITGPDALTRLVERVGLLPMFRCQIEGFSLEELTPPDRWFVDGVDGPWEWREVLAEEGKVAYGKFFCKKAGFVSREWLPILANYRRDGYDFDARWDEGLVPQREKRLMDVLEQGGPLLSHELKERAGLAKGFDTALTSLQMQTYVTVQRFEYKLDKHGRRYGWGVGRYTSMEERFGALCRAAYGEEPEQSRERLVGLVLDLCPRAEFEEAERLIRR